MARRRLRTTDRDEAAPGFPTEVDAGGVQTLEDTDEERNAGAPSADDRTDEIARRAYERYEARGGEHGHDQEDWYEAERELRGRRD